MANLITLKQQNYIIKLDPTRTVESLKDLTIQEASKLIGLLVKGQKTTTKAPAKTILVDASTLDQETLLKEYKEVLTQRWGEDNHMIDYCMKECSSVLDFDRGQRIVFDKPRIQTSFCYGHGFCGISTEEDEDRASRMSHLARTSEQYFIDENIEELETQINCVKANIQRIEDPNTWYKETYNQFSNDPTHKKDDLAIYFEKARTGEENNSFYSYTFIRSWRIEEESWRYKDTELIALTVDDLKKLLKGLENEKAKFMKRLQTYLKRYGLSKIDTWTYLRD